MARRKQPEARGKTGKTIDRGDMVELRDTSPYWQIVFSLYGKRVSKSSRTKNKREAEKMAKALWHEMDDQHVRIHGKRGVPTKQRDGRLIDVVDWFDTHFASEDVGARDTHTRLVNIVDILGPATMLSEITDRRVVEMIAELEDYDCHNDPARGKLSDDRVDAHVKTLRRLMNETVQTLKFYLPDMPDWPRHTLPDMPRTREASIEEIDAMVGAWPTDKRAALLFLFQSGLRLTNAVELTWSQVDWAKRVIRVKVKAPRLERRRKRRNIDLRRKPREIPITPVIAEILASQWGKHETAVFTLTARRTETHHKSGERHERDEHYPLKSGTFATQWHRTRRTLGIRDLRIHDLRRTRGSWLYRATGDIKLVKAFLHHANIQTTDTTYAHVMPEQVADGMVKAAAYEAEMRARLAKLVDVLPGMSPGSHPTAPMRALSAPAVTPSGIAPEAGRNAELKPCRRMRKSSTSGTPSPSITSIEEARSALRRIELNPRMQRAILDLAETTEPSVVSGILPGHAGNSALQKANCRKMTGVDLPAESRLVAPRGEKLASRFARSCEPYMDDLGFVFSAIEAFDRCFGTEAAPGGTN